MTLSRKLIDKLIKFTQSVYKIHLNQPEIPLPQEILNLIPKVEESKILARKQNLNSIVSNAQLSFESRFTLISTLLGFIGSHQILPQQMPYISLIILQSCCGIFFWELQNAGSHYLLVFIRAFSQSVPFLPNMTNEIKIFFALFVERIYNNGDIDLTIQCLPAINEVMSKHPQLSDNCIQLLLKIAKKLCKKLKTENTPIIQTNISYFFRNLSNVVSIFHQNYDHSKIIKRLLEISQLPTPTYLLESYLSLLLSFHYHNTDIIHILEQISNGLINADPSSLHQELSINYKFNSFSEIREPLSHDFQDLLPKYQEYFSNKNPQIPVIPNLSEISESISGPIVNTATIIADHFNNCCKFKDYFEFMLILLNSQNFNIQSILLLCILISGPLLRNQISELFVRKNLWKFLLNDRTFTPTVNIFDAHYSRLINLRQSIFDVLAFMCTDDEVILSIRKAFRIFLSKVVQNPKLASEVVLMSYPSLRSIYLIKMPENTEDELITLLSELVINQQYYFFKDHSDVCAYRFPTLTVIFTILKLKNILDLVSYSEYSCKALFSLLFERPLIPYIESLIIKLARIASRQINVSTALSLVPFSIAFHKLFKAIIGQKDMSDLVLKILKMIEREPCLIFLKSNLISDLFCVAFSCVDEELPNRIEILEYFLKILLKFKNFKEFDPTIVPFYKIGNVCKMVGSFITVETANSIKKSTLFDILYEICITDDIITLPEALPMLLLSLKDDTSQTYMMNKLIELCQDSITNRFSCLIGKIPSIIFKYRYHCSFELFKLISLTVSSPRSLRSFLQCFETDELFDEALKYLTEIIERIEISQFRSRIQFTSKGSHVTFPRISSTILDNGFIVHSTLFIEADEPNRNFFILRGGKNTFSIQFSHHSLMFQVESGDSFYKYSIDADYPLKKWFELSVMLKASEGLTVGFDGNIVAGLSIESVELGNNVDYSLVFFTNSNDRPKPIQMHSILFYTNFLANELSISDLNTYESILRKHLYYSFCADNVLNRALIDGECSATFSGTPFRFECDFLRAFETTQSINFLLTLFRKIEYKPKLLDCLLSIVFTVIEKSAVISNQMVKINGMAVISYFLEKLSSSELTNEKWKFFVDQIDKIKAKQLLRHFVKFIFYNFKIWSHSTLDVQMQVICGWQQIGIFFEEFLTVPFLLQTFNSFYNISEKSKYAQNFDSRKNSMFMDGFHSKNELNLSATSSMQLFHSVLQNNENESKSNLVNLASSASSSVADFAAYANSSSSNLCEMAGDSCPNVAGNDRISYDECNGNNNSLDEIKIDGIDNKSDTATLSDSKASEAFCESENGASKVGDSNISDRVGDSNISDKVGDSNISDKVGDSNISDRVGDSNISDRVGDSSDTNKVDNDTNNNAGDGNDIADNNGTNEVDNHNISDKVGDKHNISDKFDYGTNNTVDSALSNSYLIYSDDSSKASIDPIKVEDDSSKHLSSHSDDSRFDTDSDASDDSRSPKHAKLFNESIGNFVLEQQSRTPVKKRRIPFHKRSSSIESLANANYSRSFRSKSISSISYQKQLELQLNSIRKIIISLINSVISLNKLNKKEALFLFQSIQKAKQPEESLNLLEVVSFVIDSKLYMSSFDIQGQWIMLFLHRSETFRIRWLTLFSKMYPNPSLELRQSILFLLIIQTQVALNNSLLSTESLLVECIRICLGYNKVLNLSEFEDVPINFSNVKIQYFHFAIAISIAAQGELNDAFASAFLKLTTSDDFTNLIASSSSTLTLFILIYWALRRSQGNEKDETQLFSLSLDSITKNKATDFNRFSFPLKIDSVDIKAVTILSRICSFSPSLTKTAVGIIDSISTITKANLSELRSKFLNTLFPIASSADFIQIIAESLFFHYKIFDFPALLPLYQVYNDASSSKKFFDAQVPDLITLLNVYIGDIDRSPSSYFSLDIDKNGKWLDESLAKSLIYVASATKSEKLKPILSVLIFTFCRNQKQSEIASLIPLTRELITEKDSYSYLIIYSIYRERINSFLDLNADMNSSIGDSPKRRRKTEMVPAKSEDEISSRNRRRYSDLYSKFVKFDQANSGNSNADNHDQEAEVDQNKKSKPIKVKINVSSLQSAKPRKSLNSISPAANCTNVTEVPKFSYPFDDDLPESVKSLIKSDPKFLRTCYITLTQFSENSPKTLTEVHKKLIDIFSSIQSVFAASTYHKCAIHQTEKYLGKRAWHDLWHQMFTGNQIHFKRSSYTDYLSRPIILRRNFGFDRNIDEIKNAKKTDSFIENCIDSNEPLFEGRCERIKVDKTISGTFYILYTGIYRFNKEGINDKNNNQVEKKILRFISDEGKLIDLRIDDVVRVLPMFVLQKKTAVEILTEQQRSFLFNFKTCHNVNQFMAYIPLRLHFPTGKFLNNLTELWCKRNMSNYEYLTWLNLLSGRTFNSAYAYPIFPWILSDYESPTINLDDPKVYRDLSKPIGALNSVRLQKLKKLRSDNTEIDNNFLYRSTYSCAFHVFHYLVRLEPFTSLHIIMQDGKFDVAHRLFSSIYNSYERITSTFFNFRELIPEFFFNSDFLTNTNKFTFGGGIDDVSLPKWSKSPIDFIYKNRRALESEIVSQRINEWIDLIWGFKQTGQAAEDADNVFDPHLYPNVWQMYKFNEMKGGAIIDKSNLNENYFGSLAMKTAGILIRPNNHRNSFGLPKNGVVSSLVTAKNGDSSNDALDSSSALSSSQNLPVTVNQSDSLYKNPTVDSSSVPQSLFSSTSKQQIEQMLSHVGQIPQQLFDSPHPTRQPISQASSALISTSASSSIVTAVPTFSVQSSSQNLPSAINVKQNFVLQDKTRASLTDSILDLAMMDLSKSGIDSKRKISVDGENDISIEEKINKICLEFSTVTSPQNENIAICCSNERHITFRKDGRVYNSFGPLTKEKIQHLDNFIVYGNHSFAAICNSTNEIIQIELFSLSEGSSASVPLLPMSIPQPRIPSVPPSSSLSINESELHYKVIRRKSAFHVSRMTSMCKVGNSIFTGDVDGIIANESSEFLLTIHRKAIVCMAGCEALRIIVSVSSDNLVVISAADDLCFIRSFKIEQTIGKVKKVVICKGFGIISFLIDDCKILAYSVNGDYIGLRKLNLYVTNMIAVTCLSNDLDLLMISDNMKKVYSINAFEMAELTEIKEVESQVTSLNIFTQSPQQQLIIGTELGVLYFCNFNI